MIHPNKRTGLTAYAWPTKRGTPKSSKTKAQNSLFGLAQTLSKNPVYEDWQASYDGSQGTMFLQRDLLVMGMYGTLVQWVMRDGTMYYGARILTKQVQAMLDSITQVPGSIIVRTPDGWVGLPPATTAGDVLTTLNAGAVPSWQPPTGGGGGGYNVALTDALDTASWDDTMATMGVAVIPGVDMDVTATWAIINNQAGASYCACICETLDFSDGHAILSAVQGYPTFYTSSRTGRPIHYRLPFPSPVTLLKDHFYMVGYSRIDGSDTTSAQAWKAYNGYSAASFPGDQGNRLKLQATVPAAGTPMYNDGTGDLIACGMEWAVHL